MSAQLRFSLQVYDIGIIYWLDHGVRTVLIGFHEPDDKVQESRSPLASAPVGGATPFEVKSQVLQTIEFAGDVGSKNFDEIRSNDLLTNP